MSFTVKRGMYEKRVSALVSIKGSVSMNCLLASRMWYGVQLSLLAIPFHSIPLSFLISAEINVIRLESGRTAALCNCRQPVVAVGRTFCVGNAMHVRVTSC